VESYSWEGEDVCIRKLMLAVFERERGFYVDVGAHHPTTMSNTALLYAEGWRGINIDATPNSMEAFRKQRPEDTNLEIGIADVPGRKTFLRFSDPSLNGFLPEETARMHEARGFPILERVAINCLPLNDVLAKYANRPVDLLNVDVEGMDEAILRSLDLRRWRPTMIVTEILEFGPIDEVVNSPIHRYLTRNGYLLFSRLHFSAIFIDRAAYAEKHPLRCVHWRTANAFQFWRRARSWWFGSW